MSFPLFCTLFVAGVEADIDALFDAALQAEKSGDCATAGEQYQAVLVLSTSVSRSVQAQIQSLAASRLARTEACRASCEVSEEDLALFTTAKEAGHEPKRVAELCKQMLRGKDMHCRGYAEIRAFCPAPAAEVDPCKTTAPVRAELSGIAARVSDLDARARRTLDIDALGDLNHTVDQTHERLFELRERFLYCDNVHRRLVAASEKLKTTRQTVANAVGAAYVSRMSAVTRELAELKTQALGAEKKLALVSRLNDAILADLTRLAQTRVIGTAVNVEGSRRQDEAQQAALAQALQGEREALEQLVSAKPEFFGDASPRALAAKRDELTRLDVMMARYAGRGEGGLAFTRARSEVKESLALLDEALIHAERGKRNGRAHVILYVLGVATAVGCTFVFARRRRPELKLAGEND